MHTILLHDVGRENFTFLQFIVFSYIGISIYDVIYHQGVLRQELQIFAKANRTYLRCAKKVLYFLIG